MGASLSTLQGRTSKKIITDNKECNSSNLKKTSNAKTNNEENHTKQNNPKLQLYKSDVNKDEMSDVASCSGQSFCQDEDCSKTDDSDGSWSDCPYCNGTNEDAGQFDLQRNEREDDLGELEYCSLGSLCSRRATATMKSRIVKGPRKRNNSDNKEKMNTHKNNLENDSNTKMKKEQQENLRSDSECKVDIKHVAVPVVESAAVEKLECHLTELISLSSSLSSSLEKQLKTLMLVFKMHNEGSLDLEKSRGFRSKLNEIECMRDEKRDEVSDHRAAVAEGAAQLNCVQNRSSRSLVREMKEASVYYSNRVLLKHRDNEKHVNWVRTWLRFVNGLEMLGIHQGGTHLELQVTKPVQTSSSESKRSKTILENNKWLMEHLHNAQREIEVQSEHSVYIFDCHQCSFRIVGKANRVLIDQCSHLNISIDTLISGCELIHCQKIDIDVRGRVPTINIGHSDNCQVVLSPTSASAPPVFVTAKSSDVNVKMAVENEAVATCLIPDRFKTVIGNDNRLITTPFNTKE